MTTNSSPLTATLAALDTRLAAEAASEERFEAFAADYGYDWEVRAGYGDRYIGESEVTDPDTPVFYRYGSDDPGRWIPGSMGE